MQDQPKQPRSLPPKSNRASSPLYPDLSFVPTEVLSDEIARRSDFYFIFALQNRERSGKCFRFSGMTGRAADAELVSNQMGECFRDLASELPKGSCFNKDGEFKENKL